jgi:hypothetical protein
LDFKISILLGLTQSNLRKTNGKEFEGVAPNPLKSGFYSVFQLRTGFIDGVKEFHPFLEATLPNPIYRSGSENRYIFHDAQVLTLKNVEPPILY